MSIWLPAWELSITGSGDPRTRPWKWTQIDSSSSKVAELVQVRWLEITGKFNVRKLKQKTSYAAFLVFKLRNWSSELEKATASVRFTKEICEENGREGYFVFIDTKNCNAKKGRFPRQRNDGWMEIKLGDFFNNLGDDGEVEMRLFETDYDKWKSGLLVRGIEIRPN